jgi:GT2 family glycosyltransferase
MTAIKKTKFPGISIIITCYNLESYLLEAVESVKAQTLQPQEIIVVHDGCKKPALIPGTTVLFREKNIGVALSRDEGFHISNHQLILFLDADDVLTENFLQESVETIKTASIAYPSILLWSYWSDKPKKNEMHYAPTSITKDNLYKFNQVTVTSLMSRDVYEKVGGFDPTLLIWEDWDFFIKALRAGFKFKRTNAYIKYRQRKDSRNHQDDSLKKETYEVIKKRYVKK